MQANFKREMDKTKPLLFFPVLGELLYVHIDVQETVL